WGVIAPAAPPATMAAPVNRCGARAVKGVVFQWVQFPPGKGSLQPVAIGAAVEVTILPKPSMQRVTNGDPASMQAVTRVNAEQASKMVTREPAGRATGKAAAADSRGATLIPSAVPPG